MYVDRLQTVTSANKHAKCLKCGIFSDKIANRVSFIQKDPYYSTQETKSNIYMTFFGYPRPLHSIQRSKGEAGSVEPLGFGEKSYRWSEVRTPHQNHQMRTLYLLGHLTQDQQIREQNKVYTRVDKAMFVMILTNDLYLNLN